LPSQRQLRHANESLARANRELEAFTASVSHDLRSPLTTIAGQAGLLELSMGALATEDQKRRLHRIQASVKNMSDLIDALLVLSRISRHTLHRETVDISALAEQIIADLRQKHPERHVQVDIEPGLHVHGDRRLISDLFANLLGNAWKFTSKTAEARIQVGQLRDGAMATLFVREFRYGVRAETLQTVSTPARRRRIRRIRSRTRHGRAYRRSPWRSHLGRGAAERRRYLQLHTAHRTDYRHDTREPERPRERSRVTRRMPERHPLAHSAVGCNRPFVQGSAESA
jgi:light-regulated signal transduction histidine kinase (bacteriophytochrome)